MPVIVAAESSHKHEETNANVFPLRVRARNLYRRLDLPNRINVDRVTASLMMECCASPRRGQPELLVAKD